MGECLEGRRVIITGRFFAAAASAIVVRTTIKVRGRKWSGRSAKNDAKYGRTDSNNRWRLTSLNDVIFQPMRSLDFFITNHVIITRLKLWTTKWKVQMISNQTRISFHFFTIDVCFMAHIQKAFGSAQKIMEHHKTISNLQKDKPFKFYLPGASWIFCQITNMPLAWLIHKWKWSHKGSHWLRLK